MTSENEVIGRRYHEQRCDERQNELAPELFTADHRMIAETHEVWDTLGFLQQIGVVPA
jgi:hypothetical protein